ncbi:MAG TPA: glycosyltransferase [Candidatus Bathyarchaeia archaeon]|nr:glycosyltransferase [Candidatus Bathyarchaeia archaeon]
MKKVFLSVIIPCYNEEANLQKGVLAELAGYLSKQKYSWEVIISDDGSTDASKKIVKNYIANSQQFLLLANIHGGKAFALKSGIEKAQGEIILTADMDQSTPIKELEKLLPWFKKGFPIVIGSRGLVRKGTAWYRKLMTIGFRMIRGVFLLGEINDTQCGFKAYRTEVIKSIFPKLEIFKDIKEVKGWRVSAIDVELLFLAQKKGYKIKEIQVEWQNRDLSKTKQHNFLRESQNMFFEVIRVKLNDWRGKYV